MFIILVECIVLADDDFWCHCFSYIKNLLKSIFAKVFDFNLICLLSNFKHLPTLHHEDVICISNLVVIQGDTIPLSIFSELTQTLYSSGSLVNGLYFVFIRVSQVIVREMGTCIITTPR